MTEETSPTPDAREVLRDLTAPFSDYHGDLPDFDHPLRCVYDSGIQYAVELLAKVLRVETYDVCDGTEDFDGDLGGTMLNIVMAALPKDADGDHMHPRDVHAALSTPRADAARTAAPEEASKAGCDAEYPEAFPASDAARDRWLPHQTGYALSFLDGILNINRDGSGSLAFREDALEWEETEAGDYRYQNLPASELLAIRDALNARLSTPSPDARAVELLREACRLGVIYDDLLRSYTGPVHESGVLLAGNAARIDAAYDAWVRAARRAVGAPDLPLPDGCDADALLAEQVAQ